MDRSGRAKDMPAGAPLQPVVSDHHRVCRRHAIITNGQNLDHAGLRHDAKALIHARALADDDAVARTNQAAPAGLRVR